MKPFDPTKPVQTRSGKKARIICTDRRGHNERPIIALVDHGGNETVLSYYPDGTLEGDDNDLVNIPETVTVWITVHRIEGGFNFIARPHFSEAAAKAFALKDFEAEGYSYICTHSTEVTLP